LARIATNFYYNLDPEALITTDCYYIEVIARTIGVREVTN